MPSRKYSATDNYRYGFNGKENDNDVKGEGNQQDYGMRIYDPRLGRFLSVDPLTQKYPELTPYQFASNMPIESIDLDGAERLSYLQRNESYNPIDFVGNLPGNVFVGGANAFASAWNKIVDYGDAIFNSGDPIGGFNQQVGKDWDALCGTFSSIWNYHTNTPIKQQVNDLVNDAKNLDNWSQATEGAFLFYLGGRGTTVLKPGTAAVSAIKVVNTAEKITAGIVQNSSKIAERIRLAKGFMGDAFARYTGDISINFNKAVYKQSIGTKTFKTKSLVQWRDPKNPNSSPFFTFEGVDPQTLGIPNSYTKKYKVILDKEYTFLRSTANDVPAFRPEDAGKIYKGGGTQLYSQEAAKKATFIPAN